MVQQHETTTRYDNRTETGKRGKSANGSASARKRELLARARQTHEGLPASDVAPKTHEIAPDKGTGGAGPGTYSKSTTSSASASKRELLARARQTHEGSPASDIPPKKRESATRQGATIHEHEAHTSRLYEDTYTSDGTSSWQEPALGQMDLHMLMRRCASESERFYRGQQHDTRYSYELFRRALVERSESAWEQLYRHYCGLVEGWVRRSGAFTSSGESSEFFVVGAFTKFWRAVTPDRFDSFPTLASLLHYLQLCATSVVIDSVRTQSWSEMVPEDAIGPSVMPHYSPDEEALNRVHREEFWKLIDAQLHDEIERVVVYCSFILGLTPRAIFAKRGDLFNSVNDVYNVKRNVLGRLGRNTTLRQMFATI